MTKPSNGRSRIDRRSLLKYSVAGGAVLATASVCDASASQLKLIGWSREVTANTTA